MIAQVRAIARTRRITAWIVGRRREQPLGGRVHQHDVARLVGDENWVGDRVDDEIQPMPLVAHFGLATRSVR